MGAAGCSGGGGWKGCVGTHGPGVPPISAGSVGVHKFTSSRHGGGVLCPGSILEGVGRGGIACGVA
eukprot:2250802-Pyramimonas_sp.AAC.1